MQGLLLTTIATGCLLLAAGCGDDTEPSAASPDASSSATDSPSPSATAEPLAPPTDARIDRELTIPDGADWLVEGFGSLWVKRDNGTVHRVSYDGKVEAAIDADIFQPPVCQGIGVSDDAVWACATGGTLIRIDPATNEFTTVEVPKVNEQGRLTSSGGLVWVLTGDGDRLEGIAPDGSTETTIELGTFCTEVSDSAPGEVLWVTCIYDGVLLQVDLAAGEVVGEVADLPGATSVSVAGDVWVGYDEGLARVDPESLEVVGTTPLGVTALRATDDAVLVRGSGDEFLTVLDPVSGEVTSRLSAPGLASGGDVIVVDGQTWATAYDDNALVRLRR